MGISELMIPSTDLSRLVCLEARDERLVRMGRKILSTVSHPIHAVGHPGYSIGDIQLPLILVARLVPRKCNRQVSQRLKRLNEIWAAHHLFLEQVLGLLGLARKDQFPDGPKMLVGVFPVVVMRATGPQGILIKLKSLVSAPAKDHGTQAAITNRQGFVPIARRFTVPKLHSLLTFDALQVTAGNAAKRMDGALRSSRPAFSSRAVSSATTSAC